LVMARDGLGIDKWMAKKKENQREIKRTSYQTGTMGLETEKSIQQKGIKREREGGRRITRPRQEEELQRDYF